MPTPIFGGEGGRGGEAPIIPVREGAPDGGPAIVISLSEFEGHSVYVEGEMMSIMAPDEEALNSVFGKLLRALDGKCFTAMKSFYPNSGIKGQALTWDEEP